MKNDIGLLDLMLADQKDQRAIYKPGPEWSEKIMTMSGAIRADGLENFRSTNTIGRSYSDAVTFDPTAMWDMGNLKLRMLKQLINIPPINKVVIQPFIRQIERYFGEMGSYRDLYYDSKYKDLFDTVLSKYDLPDTLVGNTRDVLNIGDTRIASRYFRYLLGLYNYSQKVDFSKITSVFEIGGGFGGNAHVLLHVFPNIRKYLYLDIPPVLYVGTQYLKHFFGADIVDYRSTRNLDDIKFSNDDTREVICICPWQIERVDAEIELFWNAASFEEMEEFIVDNYAEHIKRLMPGSQDTFLCLLLGDSHHLSQEQVIRPFSDRFEVAEFEPSAVLEWEKHLFLGTPR